MSSINITEVRKQLTLIRPLRTHNPPPPPRFLAWSTMQYSVSCILRSGSVKLRSGSTHQRCGALHSIFEPRLFARADLKFQSKGVFKIGRSIASQELPHATNNSRAALCRHLGIRCDSAKQKYSQPHMVGQVSVSLHQWRDPRRRASGIALRRN